MTTRIVNREVGARFDRTFPGVAHTRTGADVARELNVRAGAAKAVDLAAAIGKATIGYQRKPGAGIDLGLARHLPPDRW